MKGARIGGFTEQRFFHSSSHAFRARGEDPKVTSILDKAIAALGGEERLGTIKGFTWVGTVTFNVNGEERSSDAEFTVYGLDHLRRKWGSNLIVVADDQAWQKHGDATRELMADAVAKSGTFTCR